MRICSLLPGATEMIDALGLSDDLVGISHECDFPPSVLTKPVMVESYIPNHGLASAEIDRRVGALVASGRRLYRLDETRLRETRPDIILSQDLCHVCAVTPDQIHEAIRSLPHQPVVLTLNPNRLDDVISDMKRVSAAVGQPARGHELARQWRRRIDAVQERVRTASCRPRVVCLEWLSPLYVAGHWVPEMVQLAGGRDVLAEPGNTARRVTWNEVLSANPEVVIVMPCGFSVARTKAELAQLMRDPNQWPLPAALFEQTFLVDANSYFSRPGPRLIDGIEILASLFHPTTHDPLDESRACRLTARPLQPQ